MRKKGVVDLSAKIHFIRYMLYVYMWVGLYAFEIVIYVIHNTWQIWTIVRASMYGYVYVWSNDKIFRVIFTYSIFELESRHKTTIDINDGILKTHFLRSFLCFYCWRYFVVVFHCLEGMQAFRIAKS